MMGVKHVHVQELFQARHSCANDLVLLNKVKQILYRFIRIVQ